MKTEKQIKDEIKNLQKTMQVDGDFISSTEGRWVFVRANALKWVLE